MSSARRTRGTPRVLAIGLALAALVLAPILGGCGGGGGGSADASAAASPSTAADGAPLVTFIELGADKCVPCKEMQPVMRAIEKTFGDQVEVVFYDVWEDPAPANEFGIQMIPTQVFLDANGDEFHRHAGFYPQADIEALLVEQGLTKLTGQ